MFKGPDSGNGSAPGNGKNQSRGKQKTKRQIQESSLDKIWVQTDNCRGLTSSKGGWEFFEIRGKWPWLYSLELVSSDACVINDDVEVPRNNEMWDIKKK